MKLPKFYAIWLITLFFCCFVSLPSHAKNPMDLNGDGLITDEEKVKSQSPEIANCINQPNITPAPAWRLMSNGCVDYCDMQDGPCFEALTEGCDCGRDRCFDRMTQSCIKNK